MLIKTQTGIKGENSRRYIKRECMCVYKLYILFLDESLHSVT